MPAPPLDPEIAAALSALPATMPTIDADILPAVRNGRILGLELPPLSDRVTRTDHTVPGPAGDPDIIVRIHVPDGLERPAPCLFSIHGGGYILGDRSQDDLRFDRLCPDLGFIGASVEYRLAPETPYPGPLEDCYAGLQWVHEHAAEMGVDPSRIGIAGASAGGGLAAGLALLTRDRGGPSVAFQLLAYPMIDDRRITPSSSWDVPIWSPGSNEFGWRSYLGDLFGSDDVPCHAAPARATDLSGLPPAMIYVGTVDGFCDEDVSYATALYRSGVPTDLRVYAGAPHGFDGFAPTSAAARRCHRDTRDWLEAALHRPLG